MRWQSRACVGESMTMGFGIKSVRVSRPPDEVFDQMRQALDRIGRIKEEREPEFLRGSTRYGLQRVSLKVTIVPRADGSSIEVESFGDDVWGRAARKGIEKLLKASGLQT